SPSTMAFHAWAVTGSPALTLVLVKLRGIRPISGLRMSGCGPEGGSAAQAEDRIHGASPLDWARTENPTVIQVLHRDLDSGSAEPLERGSDPLRCGGAVAVERSEPSGNQHPHCVRHVLHPRQQHVRRLGRPSLRRAENRSLEKPDPGPQ